MIASLTGTISHNGASPLTVVVGGVGYRVFVPQGHLPSYPQGSTKTIHIHTRVTDESIDLFGLRDTSELELFVMLQTVSGVGPKTALLVIDRGRDAVTDAIRKSDVAFFTAIPRLGKKNAQKIIIELSSKIGASKDIVLGGKDEEAAKELTDALHSMGFDRKEIARVIPKLALSDRPIEALIREALRELGGRR